ncbi:hypothetical protein FOZ63_016373, partial [Perkinsus olseni]
GQIYGHAAKELRMQSLDGGDRDDLHGLTYRVEDYRIGLGMAEATSASHGRLQRPPRGEEPVPEPVTSAASLAARVRNADIEVEDVRQRRCWLTPGHLTEFG